MTSRNIFTSSTPANVTTDHPTFEGTSLAEKHGGPDSRLAINKEKAPGVMFGRPTTMVDTPDGKVEAIIMCDGDSDLQQGMAKNPSYDVPDHVSAWTATSLWAPTTATDVALSVNERFAAYAQNFLFWQGCLVVKLVCKMALTVNERVYVNWDSVKKPTGKNGVGFEWSPIERNEIYVMLPWSSALPMASTADIVSDLPSLFGYLNTSLLGSSKAGDTVMMNAYVIPTDVSLYNIKPFPKPQEPVIYSKPITVTDQVTFEKPAQAWLTGFLEATPPYSFGVNLLSSLVDVSNVTTNIDIVTMPAGVSTFVTFGTISSTTVVLNSLSDFIVTPALFHEQGNEDIETVKKMDEGETDAVTTGHTPDAVAPGASDKAFGKNDVVASREVQQFFPVYDTSLSTTTKIVPVVPVEMLINYARHYLWTKYPLVKIVATQSITNPARLRVVQVPKAYSTTPLSVDDLMQFPGYEWDPKDGDLDLEPYWDRKETAYASSSSTSVVTEFANFLPDFYIHVINKSDSVDIPISVFMALAGSSYSGIRSLVKTLPTFEQQGGANSRVKRPIDLAAEKRMYKKKCSPFTTVEDLILTSIEMKEHEIMYDTDPSQEQIDTLEELKLISKDPDLDAEYQDMFEMNPAYTACPDYYYRLRTPTQAYSLIYSEGALEVDARGKLYVKLHKIPFAFEQGVEEGGDQFQTAISVQPMDEDSTKLGKDWTYVDTYNLTATSEDPTPTAVMDLNANSLGVYARQEAARHLFRRGEQEFRIFVQTPKTVAGAFTVAHIDFEPATQLDLEVVRQYPHQTTTDNSPADLKIGWRVTRPWLTKEENNGLLYMFFNGGVGVGSDQNIIVTLYTKAQNIQFARPTSFQALPAPSRRLVINKNELPLIEVSRVGREQSFSRLNISRDDLTKLMESGMYLCERVLTCPCCKLRLAYWDKEDDPTWEHYRHSGGPRSRCTVVKRAMAARTQRDSPCERLSDTAVSSLNQYSGIDY
jgi:hypothetical protein